mgnify:CR=1 FL=1
MDLPVAWSPEAVEDLELIAEYIARDSDYYASAVVDEILGVSRKIGALPRAGRPVPEAGDPAIREDFVYSYRLVYRIEAERVLVVAVIHGKRLLENVPNRFGKGE